MNWFNIIKRNSELKKELKKLKERNLGLTKKLAQEMVNISNKYDAIARLKEDYDRECKNRTDFEKKYNDLKEEAITFYKNDILENSLKIIGAFLNNEIPKSKWTTRQFAAQQNLLRLGQTQLKPPESSGGLGRLLGL